MQGASVSRVLNLYNLGNLWLRILTTARFSSFLVVINLDYAAVAFSVLNFLANCLLLGSYGTVSARGTPCSLEKPQPQ